MNEININITYSFFKDMFIAWFATQIRSGFTQAAERAMLKAQEHWILLDTNLRKDVVSIAKEVAHVRPYQPFTGDFITWADTRFNDKQDYNTARPLVDVLPVVDLKPYGDKKC